MRRYDPIPNIVPQVSESDRSCRRSLRLEVDWYTTRLHGSSIDLTLPQRGFHLIVQYVLHPLLHRISRTSSSFVRTAELRISLQLIVPRVGHCRRLFIAHTLTMCILALKFRFGHFLRTEMLNTSVSALITNPSCSRYV